MRAALVVVILALLSACRLDEPDDIAAASEPPAPEQVDALKPLPVALRPVQIQDEAKCRQVLALEVQLPILLTKYTERHPHVTAFRSTIGRLRSELPADGTFCSPNSDQQQQRVIAVQRQVKVQCQQFVLLEERLQELEGQLQLQQVRDGPVRFALSTQVIATRSDIAQLRGELPADASCLPNSDQHQQGLPAVAQ
jgi:hypothetical protein